MTFRAWLRRFFGPTDKLTTEELGGEHDVDHLPRPLSVAEVADRDNEPACRHCGAHNRHGVNRCYRCGGFEPSVKP